MAYYEAHCHQRSCDDSWDADTLLSLSDDDQDDGPAAHNEDDDYASDASEYSLDYEYQGPRKPKYCNLADPDSDASDLSEAEEDTNDSAAFDMWDEDPYSTNDYTWDSNDMRLTHFIKQKQKELLKSTSFWRKEKGWPRQLPASCSTTNHDQSANALCLVLNNYGFAEQLYAVYRDRIVHCGRAPVTYPTRDASPSGSGGSPMQIVVGNDGSTSSIPSTSSARRQSSSNSSNSSGHQSRSESLTWIDSDHDSSGSVQALHHGDGSKFLETHSSVSLPRMPAKTSTAATNQTVNNDPKPVIAHFVPFTKYIRRADYPPIFPQDAYLPLDFEPMCLSQKYGFMAIGGIEGEFELYCCMDSPPTKIWGTKFKSKSNVQLMTNAVQIVRLPTTSHSTDTHMTDNIHPSGTASPSSLLDENDTDGVVYEHMLIACMNEAGILVYKLPSHNECTQLSQAGGIGNGRCSVQLHSHLRCFDRVPINDAKLSPDGSRLVCVGDNSHVFLMDVLRHDGAIRFGQPIKAAIPPSLLQNDIPYSSQYVAWSASSRYFAHTSDTHTRVVIWRADTMKPIHSIDAAGYTYAIAFHPRLEGVLTFTNRYGYFHTVNLEQAMDESKAMLNILDFGRQNASVSENISVRHEITMVSFRGERDRRLRILAKINGIQWSADGRYLYVATKKRVLAYEFLERPVDSLLDVAGSHARRALEQFEVETLAITTHKRKRTHDPHYSYHYQLMQQGRAFATSKKWRSRWSDVPAHVRHKVLSQTDLASHW
ncbi:hypothetical protein BCR43DRAFT_483754 [Syncephalastrum racemosum]|uniref:WD40-repeat-containing domain protein n=1 Tax=Syncephalastrum racemosum TaxID=13706 RepID=A0A1X2HVS0_SYNRA|nr:hypothetical protein BCR43DRAFT_483754 [Syncephalastrum racemosum]